MSSSPLNTSQQQLFEQQPQQASSFIDRQLQRAMTQVRIVDLVGGFLVWGSLTLGFLLLLAITDAWIVSLSVTARLFALILIVGLSSLYLVRSLWPLVTRRINPMYAAKMLEEGQPGLKNSLINFLSFRDTPTSARQRILEAMANKAAIDLSGLSIEGTIDRAKLIRFGYLLAGLIAICAGYMIFSPKSPLTTMARIVAPLADVPPPARVEIQEVLPGEIELTFGESVEVTAEVSGLGASEVVELIYTTEDRQHVDQTIPMIWDPERGLFSAELLTGVSGIEHALVYYVRAGDAHSRQFSVALRQSPTASVEQITVVPPPYTGLPIREQTQGDVEGVEGTVVEIQGKSNFPLKTAVLELLRSDDGSKDRSDPDRKASKRIKLRVQGEQFMGRFHLELAEDRVTPLYSDFRIALLTEDQETNPNPSHYRISVFPDMAPEIEWLLPTEDTVELPVNGRLGIETRAIDRDFSIQRVELLVDHKGATIVGEELLDSSRRKDDQHLGKYNLIPESLGLQPGDTLILHAVAEDNRCDPQSGLPSPNRSRTSNITVRITGSDPKASNQGGPTSGGSSSNSETGESGSGSDSSTGQAGESQESNSEQGMNDQSGDPESSQGSSGGQTESSSEPEGEEGMQESEQPMGVSGSGTSSNSQGSQGDSAGNQTSSSGGNSETENQESTPNGSGGQDGTGEDSSGGQTSSGGSNSAANSQEDQTGSSELSSDGSAEGSESSAGQSGDEASGSEENAGLDSNRSETSGEDSGTGDQPHEGEVFEKILEKLKSQTQNSGDSADDTGETTEPTNDGNSGDLSNPQGSPQTDTPSGQSNDGSSTRDMNSGGQGDSEEGGSDPSTGQSTSNPKPASGTSSGSTPENQAGTQEGGFNAESSSDSSSGGNNADSQDSSSGDSGSETGNRLPTENPQISSGQSSDSEGSTGETSAESDGQSGSESSETGKPSAEPSSNPAGRTGDQSSGAENNSEPSSESNSADENAAGAEGQSGNASSSQSRKNSNPKSPGEEGTPGQSSREGNRGGMSEGELPEGEKANLEYSRQATDLVLEYLRDQADKPDADLLSDLNWTEQDLQEFLSRWDAMRDAAGSGSDEAKKRLDSRIRSLGLMPEGAKSNRVQVQQDNLTGVVQDGVKSSPPPEFAEKFRLFLKGAAQAESSSAKSQ
jgi:hypothetical protein